MRGLLLLPASQCYQVAILLSRRRRWQSRSRLRSYPSLLVPPNPRGSSSGAQPSGSSPPASPLVSIAENLGRDANFSAIVSQERNLSVLGTFRPDFCQVSLPPHVSGVHSGRYEPCSPQLCATCTCASPVSCFLPMPCPRGISLSLEPLTAG